MSTPTKLVIETTGEAYTHRLLDGDGNEIWADKHVMESAGSSRWEKKDQDIYSSPIADDYDELAEAIDDLSFGPFDVASALYTIAEES